MPASSIKLAVVRRDSEQKDHTESQLDRLAEKVVSLAPTQLIIESFKYK
jgi:hypothetical protein